MPYYAGLRRKDAATRKRVVGGLRRLRRTIADAGVPPRTIEGNLLIATWNIREFDSKKYGGRLTDAFYFIAEIISHFDLVAIQEVREDLSALEQVCRLLGGWWKYIVTDITAGRSGNGERIAFLYDSRKVIFGGLAGEIVLPPQKVDTEVLQFARTPFQCGFKSGWARFDLCTVHILYGSSQPLNKRRLTEIRKLSKFLAGRAKKSAAKVASGKVVHNPDAENIVLLGDFNIFDTADATLTAITDQGFVIPKALRDRKGSNLKQNRFYDQIAIWRDRKRFDDAEIGGVLDYYKAVYRDADKGAYTPMIGPTKSGAMPTYAEWKTYQMSDHLILWAAFKVDYADDYLKELGTG